MCALVNLVLYWTAIGGHRGFSKVIWTVKEYVGGGDSPHITLYYRSFDGEQGGVQKYIDMINFILKFF